MITVVEVQNKLELDNALLEQVLMNEIKIALKEANYFRNRDKGTLVFKFNDHGHYVGNSYTQGD
jgi:hypothetical protein